MSIETEADRIALENLGGDSAIIGATSVPGSYDEPGADVIGVEGVDPTFLVSARLVAQAAIVRGTQLLVSTHDGRTRGPFRVVRWMPVDDGAFIELGLETL